ncbi:protein C3orf33 homolog [Orycteropus afer afer]|uniref:Protein C3orf33 homolog n=1 Tax=Orycteropus afer afer TaxID=1230840 RepID=A0A8B7A1D7_ORYAF|nr:protein C3orf33 homolog [Orycteropus afer afer]
MAGRPEALASPPRDRDGTAPNVVARISQWADDHLILVRNISTGMAVAGIMLLLRSVRVFYLTFLEEPCGALLVKLAGVELTESGKVWLQKELKPSQLLWFQLLGRENSVLFCYLLVNKGGYFNVSLNEEILRRGLGKTVLVKGLDCDSKMYWTIHRNLLKAELMALKRREGIWKEESEKETYVEKLKGSWGEIWKKDGYFSKIGSNFTLKKESYYDNLRRTYETWKENMSNYSLILKFRELMSRMYFRRKE